MRIRAATSLWIVFALVSPGCSRPGTTQPSGPTGQAPVPAAQAPAPPAGKAARVVITGAVSKTYTPGAVTAVRISDSAGISLYQDFPCSVDIQFPLDSPPGTYAIEDVRNQGPIAKVFARYGVLCDESQKSYESIGGKLVLTASGKSFSGSFEFDAGNVKDKAKRIHVSGAFKDAALP